MRLSVKRQWRDIDRVNYTLIPTGRPCNGPTVFPVFERTSSSSLARARASSGKNAVKQFTYNSF